jgi:hypothetical protein
MTLAKDIAATRWGRSEERASDALSFATRNSSPTQLLEPSIQLYTITTDSHAQRRIPTSDWLTLILIGATSLPRLWQDAH